MCPDWPSNLLSHFFSENPMQKKAFLQIIGVVIAKLSKFVVAQHSQMHKEANEKSDGIRSFLPIHSGWYALALYLVVISCDNKNTIYPFLYYRGF